MVAGILDMGSDQHDEALRAVRQASKGSVPRLLKASGPARLFWQAPERREF